MTNKEYMIALLSDEDFVDDGGASREAMVHYSIACPYYGNDERRHCKKEEMNREICVACKIEWLESEVDGLRLAQQEDCGFSGRIFGTHDGGSGQAVKCLAGGQGL